VDKDLPFSLRHAAILSSLPYEKEGEEKEGEGKGGGSSEVFDQMRKRSFNSWPCATRPREGKEGGGVPRRGIFLICCLLFLLCSGLHQKGVFRPLKATSGGEKEEKEKEGRKTLLVWKRRRERGRERKAPQRRRRKRRGIAAGQLHHEKKKKEGGKEGKKSSVPYSMARSTQYTGRQMRRLPSDH